jgi:ferredoxin
VPYSVRIDKNSCQSSGNCVEAAPEAFDFDADGLGDAGSTAGTLTPARLLEIARRCPALAISVCDEAGNELDPAAAPEA